MSTPQPQIHTKNGSSDDEEIHQLFTSLLSSPSHDNDSSSSTNCIDSNTQDFQRHYHISSLNTNVIIRQIPSQGISFKLWPAATTLFTLLDTPFLHRHLPPSPPPRKLRILELGSGTGLVGIATAAILGADVTVTDLPGVIPNLEYNVAANAGVISASGGIVVVAELTWGNSDQMEAVGRKYEVIVGSDLVYHDHLYEPLLETLKYFLVKEVDEEKEVVFLMAHLKRWKKEKVFFNKAKKMFKVDEIYREDPDDGKRVGVIVYRFVPKQKQRRSSKNKLQISSNSQFNL